MDQFRRAGTGSVLPSWQRSHSPSHNNRAFHALEDAAGLDPWNPDALYHWAVENLHTDAERHCARFILGVWNQDDFEGLDGQLGRFDALRAIAAWDHAHRAAFAVWTLDPWWP